MKRIFGQKKEKPPTPTIEEANARLNNRGETLDEKIKKLDAQLVQHRENIRKARPGPAQDMAKRRAMGVLKQKRLLETQRDQLFNQQFNMEQTSFALESMKDSAQTVAAMKQAGQELKQAFKSNDLNISSIERLQDEMADYMDMHNEIQEVMGQTFGVPDDIDEDELLGELDALEDELAAEATGVGEGAVPSYLQDVELPDAPHKTAQPARPQAVAEGADDFGLPAVPQRN